MLFLKNKQQQKKKPQTTERSEAKTEYFYGFPRVHIYNLE